MKISQLTLPARVETTTDAYAELTSEYHRDNYIGRYGDMTVTYDSVCRVYRVPVWAEQIASYTAAKARDCAIHGCE